MPDMLPEALRAQQDADQAAVSRFANYLRGGGAVADGLIYVPLPRATVGLMVVDGVIAKVPPYVRRNRWVGRDARQVWRELRRQGVDVEWVEACRAGHPNG